MQRNKLSAIVSAARGVVLASAFVGIVNSAHGVVTTWTGSGSDNLWNDPSNWNNGAPGGSDTGIFGAISTNGESISLSAGPQPITNITFSATPATFTLGTDPGDVFTMAGSGQILMTAGAVTQNINAGISLASGTLTINNNSSAGNALNLNGVISGNAGVKTAFGTNANIIAFNAQNTYTGLTDLNSNTNTIQIGSSSVLNGTTLVSGPFGVGTFEPDNSSNSNIQATNADQIVANPVFLATGFTITSASTPHNLTFSGPMNFSSATRTMKFNNYGAVVYVGSSTAPSTITLPLTTSAASQTCTIAVGSTTGTAGTTGIAATAAAVVINDAIVDPATAPPVPDGVIIETVSANPNVGGVILLNGASTYGGPTAIMGTTSATNATITSSLTVGLGVSSVTVGSGTATSIVSGPFGKGTVTLSAGNSNVPTVFQAIGGDRLVANAMVMTATGGGFILNNPSGTGVLADTSPHNIIFSGNITEGGRTLNNNLASGVGLYLGSGTATAIMTLTGTFATQSQGLSTWTNTYINDQVVGAAGFTVQEHNIVYLNSNTNTYGGSTTVNTLAGLPGALVIGAPGALGASVLKVTGGNVTAAPGLMAPIAVTGGFTITSGSIDITNDAALVNYTGSSPASFVRQLLTTGFNAGAWNGTSASGTINSSTAATDAATGTGLQAVGYNDLASGSTFDGVTLNSSAIAVRETYYGDSNLDGTVNAADFQMFINGLENSGSTWAQGDYTYDGVVDLGNDFNLFLRSYLTLNTGASAGDLIPIVEDSSLSGAQKSELLAALAPVPEPTSVGLLAVGALATLSRRRRRQD